MEKLTLTRVYRKDKISKKNNKPYTSLGLKATEYGEDWINGFGNKDNSSWKEGDVVEVEIKKDGQYINFEMPKSNGTSPELIAKVNQILENTVTILNKLSGEKGLEDGPPEHREPNDLDDVPF